MAGYIGSKASVTQVDGYNRTEADAEFVQVTGDTMSGNLSFGDSDKAVFGDGSDLQIYHDGSNSYIKEAGQGALVLQGTHMYLKSTADEYYLKNTADGSVEIYNNGSRKLATTSTGLDVTGTVTASQFVGGGAIILVGSQSNGTTYTTTSTSYQTATRFQITPSSSTSQLLGWFFCQMRAVSGQSDGDLGNTARVHYLNSSNTWTSLSNVAANLRTETGSSTGIHEIPVTFPVFLGQSALNPNGVWDVAVRHYEIYDSTSNIDDGRLHYMEYEP